MGTPSEPSRREVTSPTTPDPFASQWEQLRPQLRSWWDRLTEADQVQIGGQKVSGRRGHGDKCRSRRGLYCD